jgi:outer membrane protein assembly complex protein YaeT
MTARALPVALLLCAVALAACKEEGTVRVASLTFGGVHAVSEPQLRAALVTRQSSRLPWGKRRFFDRAQFEADLKRLQAFYSDRGYPDARVASFDVRMNAAQDAADVTIVIEEGRPVTIDAITFYGFDRVAADRLGEFRAALPFKAGDIRERTSFAAAQTTVQNLLRDDGYAYARVWVTEELREGGYESAIAVTADPGPPARFGAISISGNTSVGDHVIRRELTYHPGDRFSRSQMLATQRGLYSMELFQFANVTAVDTDEQPPDVRTRVTVAEAKHQTVNFGVGYGTEERVRVDGEYRHLNFLGGARSAGIHARWSSLDRGLRLSFTQPYFVLRGYSLTAEGQQWYTYTPAYQTIVSGARVAFVHQARSKRESWSASILTQHDHSKVEDAVLNDPKLRDDLIALGLDPSTGEQSGTLTALGGDVQWSGADSLLDAHRGFQLSGHVEYAGRPLPGTFRYEFVSVDGRLYTPVRRRVVWANRLQAAALFGHGGETTAIPFSKRLFLGGATTVRGWDRYEISPLGESGFPVGGTSLVAVSTELRLSATDRIGLVGFVDAGNVWASSAELSPADLRVAIGPGVRYATPIGPLRFDVGYQLNPIPGLLINGEPQTRRFRMFFSIGQAF